MALRGPLLLLLLAVLAGCAALPPGPGGALRVGIAPNYPPIAFRADGELAGLEVDLARDLGGELGREVDFVELPFDDLIPALQAGRIDVIMSGMSVTPVRSARVAFATPYMRISQMAVIRREDVVRLGRPGALFGASARVGFEAGTTGEAFVRRELRRAEPVPFADLEQAVAALYHGRIDALVHDAPTIWRVAGADREARLLGLFWPLTEEYLAWAVRPSELALRDRLNAVLQHWRSTGRLEARVNRWMPVRLQVQ